jgi:methionyl-tRNA formyltransferase
MKLVFCGTPEFAVPTLRAVLDAGHDVALVLTQPDRPAGRKMEMQVSAVKQFALQRGLPVTQPEKLKNNVELRETLEAIQPDAIIVVAYGRIIPQWMLDLPRFGNINLHGSLLPKYRGAAPIQWAIANGERETGVTTMRLDAGLDTGDILIQMSMGTIQPDWTAPDVYGILAELGSGVMLGTLINLENGTLVPRKQDDDLATLAPILTREDGRLDLTRTAAQTYDRWRGFMPWPGCYGEFRGKRFLLHRLHAAELDLPEPIEPGLLWMHEGHLLLGVAQNTALVLDEVQLEGKSRMAGSAFWQDFQVKQGEHVE